MACPVLFVDHAPALGGAEHSLLLLLEHLDRRTFEPHLISPGGSLAEAAQSLGVKVHIAALPRLRRSPQFPVNWVSGVRVISRIARDAKARALIANTVRAAIYTAPVATLVRLPFIWYMRDFWLGESQPRSAAPDSWGKRLLCEAATHVIANSHATAAHLPCLDKVTVIHNGIDVASFDPGLEGQGFRQVYDIPAEAPVIGMVGRLRPWKGQARFLRVFARVGESLPSLHGIVVGGSPFRGGSEYLESLKVLTKTLRVTDRVHFTGQVDDPRPALAAMDIFVHPGDPEPFGLVNVEAMAMAKPVVAFAHGALPEIVVDGKTGTLVPPGDEVAMATALTDLLSDAQKRPDFGHSGRTRVEDHFDIQLTVRRYESLLQRQLGMEA